MATTIQLRGDLRSEWERINPIIQDKEFIIVKETVDGPWIGYKIGNGVKRFSQLPYGNNGSVLEVFGRSHEASLSQDFLSAQLLRLSVENDLSSGYSWRLNGLTSYLIKDPFRFLNLGKGSYEYIFIVPEDIITNQILFHIGTFMVGISGGMIRFYHRLNGGDSRSLPMTPYKNKRITLHLINEIDPNNNLTLCRVYINNKYATDFYPEDLSSVVTPTSKVYVGSYQGTALFLKTEFMSLIVRDENRTILAEISFVSKPTAEVSVVPLIYGTEECTEPVEAYAEFVPSSYVTLNSETPLVNAGNFNETYLVDVKIPLDIQSNQVLFYGEGSLMFQIIQGFLKLTKAGVGAMYNLPLIGYEGKRVKLIVVRELTEYKIFLDSKLMTPSVLGYMPMDAPSNLVHIGGILTALTSKITLYSFMKLNISLTKDLIEESLDWEKSFLKDAVWYLANSDLGVTAWPERMGLAEVTAYNIKVVNPLRTYDPVVPVKKTSFLESLPSDLYVTAGKEANIYLETLIFNYEGNYRLELTTSWVSTIQNMDRCIRFVVGGTGDFSATLNLYNKDGIIMESKELTIHSIAANKGNGTLQFLFVGDSTIDDALMIDGQPYYEHEGPQVVKMFYELSNANKGYTPLMIGHKKDYPPYFHAGMSGWASTDFLNDKSPFWFNGKNDFKHYVQTQIVGISGATDRIDYMVYQIGINDLKANSVTPESVITNIKTFVTQFLAVYPTAKVIIGFPASGNDTTGYSVHFFTTSSYINFRLKMIEFYKQIIKEFGNNSFKDNVYIANAGEWVDRIYGFPYKEIAVSSRNAKTVMEHWDSVHPNESGYNQMADAYFARVKSLV